MAMREAKVSGTAHAGGTAHAAHAAVSYMCHAAPSKAAFDRREVEESPTTSTAHIWQSASWEDEPNAPPFIASFFQVPGPYTTLSATQWQIISQSPTDATRFWWHLYGS